MIPIVVGVGGRCLKREFLGEVAHARVLIYGAITGWNS
jgi:hypothetical protein